MKMGCFKTDNITTSNGWCRRTFQTKSNNSYLHKRTPYHTATLLLRITKFLMSHIIVELAVLTRTIYVCFYFVLLSNMASYYSHRIDRERERERIKLKTEIFNITFFFY